MFFSTPNTAFIAAGLRDVEKGRDGENPVDLS
jgi:hypothetical protein